MKYLECRCKHLSSVITPQTIRWQTLAQQMKSRYYVKESFTFTHIKPSYGIATKAEKARKQQLHAYSLSLSGIILSIRGEGGIAGTCLVSATIYPWVLPTLVWGGRPRSNTTQAILTTTHNKAKCHTKIMHFWLTLKAWEARGGSRIWYRGIWEHALRGQNGNHTKFFGGRSRLLSDRQYIHVHVHPGLPNSHDHWSISQSWTTASYSTAASYTVRLVKGSFIAYPATIGCHKYSIYIVYTAVYKGGFHGTLGTHPPKATTQITMGSTLHTSLSLTSWLQQI